VRANLAEGTITNLQKTILASRPQQDVCDVASGGSNGTVHRSGAR
jgi:hypothetical protein